MAIYHLSAKIVGRSGGRSAVAAAAYRSGERLYDARHERVHDYSAKHDIAYAEILLPDGAPERFADREVLWNEVEAGEVRRDAQLAREIEFALPRELDVDEGVALARAFVAEQFVSRGMIADLCVHAPLDLEGELQPHAHVLLTMREITEQGFGAKVRDWNRREELLHWREAWAERANERLAELGHDRSIDHRSFEAIGLDLEPQTKIGPAASRDLLSERAQEHRDIAHRNGERIAEDPELALRAITYHQSTFTRHDLACFLHRHSDRAEQFAELMAKVEASPELVSLGRDDRDQERFTTREMIEVEARLERSAASLAARREHEVDRAPALRPSGIDLSDEQEAALGEVLRGDGLSLVVGVAGSGKSAMLEAAREAWEEAGYRVRGATLSAIAAQGLERSSGIESRTIASLEHGWDRGYDELTDRDILVIDEAGLLGSRQMSRVLAEADRAGAKVVALGDTEQLQAIEAGAPFRALVERHGAAELCDVWRQREDWQREATAELASGRTRAALKRYADAEAVVEHDTVGEARKALVERWAAVKPEETSILLAPTRDEAAELNRLAREKRRKARELGADVRVKTERGEREFAAGDTVMFLRNDRGLGLRNGALGLVEGVSERGMRAKVEGRHVDIAFGDYNHVDHGYAMTIHKAQGMTVDRAFVLAGPSMDRHSAYVALSRHRDGVELHYGRDDFASEAQLARRLSRERLKDMTLDYKASFGARREIEQEAKAGRFAGLRLEAFEPARRDLARRADSLELAEERYQAAVRDAERMREKGLPVLAHQALALAKARGALEALAPRSLRPSGIDREPLVRGIEREPVGREVERDFGMEL